VITSSLAAIKEDDREIMQTAKLIFMLFLIVKFYGNYPPMNEGLQILYSKDLYILKL
jgi:hypothetical protein